MSRTRSTPQTTLVFDVETTGTDRRRDQVIELCAQFGLGGDARSRTWRIRPTVPISPGAQAVHGISMADLSDCPTFGYYADEIRGIIETADVLVGYNIAFDIALLQAEYERLEQPWLDVSATTIIDAFRLWQQCEPRSLQHAHQRFVGDSFSQAHSATADVAATGRVLQGMIESFGLAGRDWGEIARVCEPERQTWIGPSRHVRWSSPSEPRPASAGERAAIPVIGFGRHAGTPVHKLARSPDADYLRWMLDRDFPQHVRQICRMALDLPEQGFLSWVEQTFGAAARQQPAHRAAAGA